MSTSQELRRDDRVQSMIDKERQVDWASHARELIHCRTDEKGVRRFSAEIDFDLIID